MNNKRQTIWLVSMLSLMVILSAYYLFTEDVTPAQNAAGTKQQTEAGGAQKTTGDMTDGVQVTEIEPAADGLDGAAVTDGKANSADAGKTDETAAQEDTGKADGKDGGVAAGDEAVLKEMTNLKGSQLIDELQRRQQETYASKSEELSTIVADTKNHSQEQASSAMEDLVRLQDTDERMTSLEEKLFQDYDNAVVVEEDMNFKVVVQAEKLGKKEAVKIIDMAAKELNVTPDRLSVQYVN